VKQFGQTLLSGNRGRGGLPYNFISRTPFPVWVKLICQEQILLTQSGGLSIYTSHVKTKCRTSQRGHSEAKHHTL